MVTPMEVIMLLSYAIGVLFPIVCGWFLYKINKYLNDMNWQLYMLFHDQCGECFGKDEYNE